MNFQELKEILEINGIEDEVRRALIINSLAKDENVIADVLHILSNERALKSQLIGELNFQLGRARMSLEHRKLNKEHFLEKEIDTFYNRWAKYIKNNFQKPDKNIEVINE